MFTLFLVLLFHSQLTAQEQIKGQVLDQETKEGLAFVTLIFNDGHTGISADINGRFQFTVPPNLSKITFSSIGFESQTLSLQEIQKIDSRIVLKKSAYNLNEVEILPGINPAHRLINNAIANREKNNPELATEFYYESYNKLIFTSPLDSNSKSQLDSITLNHQSSLDKLDSIPVNKVAFVMESIAERNHFPPDFSKEVVTQSRISGLKTPFFSLLGTQLQSFSLYKDFITIYGINYLSPISKGSTDKYLFVLEDTLFQGKDTSFIISFRPRKNKYFQALSGVLSINTNQYAVENFAAKQHDKTSFPVQVLQRYQFIDQKQWFPTQLNINIFFNSDIDGGLTIVGKGNSYLRNIELQSRIDRKNIGNLVISTDPEIKSEDNAFWEAVREVPLSENEKISYQFLDSIGGEVKLDRIVFLNKGLLRGYLPIGKVNLTLNRLLRFNQFENVRLGAGLETSERINERFRLGAFAGYGLRDKEWKYGGHLRIAPKGIRQFEAKIAYSKDILAIGGTSFNKQAISYTSTNNVRNFINDQYDEVEKYEASASMRLLRDFHFTVFGNRQDRTVNSTYQFLDERENLSNPNYQYQLLETGIDIRFSYKEKFGEMLGVILPVETKYPVVYLKYTKGLVNDIGGNFDYNRVDFSFYKTSLIKGLGRTFFQVNAGIVDNQIPLTSLYVMQGILDPDFRVASSFNFETMLPNEFYADQYASFFFRHDFGSLLFKSPKFKPQFLLVSSFAIGSLQSPELHENFDFKTLEHGFSESGIQINNLLRIKYFYDGIYLGFGGGTYYRYGAYSNPEFKDNIAFKLTTTVSL